MTTPIAHAFTKVGEVQFLTRIAEREGYGCTREQAHTHAQAVLGTLASFVSRGELDDLRRQLPSGYAELFTLPQ